MDIADKTQRSVASVRKMVRKNSWRSQSLITQSSPPPPHTSSKKYFSTQKRANAYLFISKKGKRKEEEEKASADSAKKNQMMQMMMQMQMNKGGAPPGWRQIYFYDSKKICAMLCFCIDFVVIQDSFWCLFQIFTPGMPAGLPGMGGGAGSMDPAAMQQMMMQQMMMAQMMNKK